MFEVTVSWNLADVKAQIFDAEMQSFFLLFNRFLLDRAKGEKL